MAIDKYAVNVKGRGKSDILLFALSTCGWCRKTRDLLDTLGVSYRYIYVDLLDEPARNEVKKEVARWNPANSFPTMVVNNKSIVGYQEDKIREAVGGG